ncbi:MAG: type I DNA topoisomerase [Phenylobacterium sp.]
MAKYLVILESPGKVKKVQSYLGKEYDVVASYGHVMDLPKKQLGVNIKKDFEATFEVMPDKMDVVKNIISKAKKSQVVYIMTDGDREGAGIGRNIYELIRKECDVEIKRAKTFEIKKEGVVDAIKNAYNIDDEDALVKSFETRRILDRLVGFKTSFLVTQASGGKSAGRVQSAALRIIADRENEIISFIPEVYYSIKAELVTKDFEKIMAIIKVPDQMEIKTEEEAKKICEQFKKNKTLVSKFDKKEFNSKPYSPFTTSLMIQSASSFLGMDAKATMSSAQSLYESGLITYHRTDSSSITASVISEIRDRIFVEIGQEYLHNQVRHYSSSKNAQEAHEAIRPTEIPVVAGTNLYKMIWKRAMASQMSDARYIKSTGEFTSGNYILAAHGSKRTFDGWRKIWDYGTDSDSYLPELKVGDEVKVIDISYEKCETSPPSRYTDNSIVKKLEQMGIGRPSTYASILDTLKNRKYIEVAKKSLKATQLGLDVNKFLVTANFCFIDLKFTAGMEDNLDLILNGEKNKLDVLNNFWTRLKDDIANSKTVKQNLSLTEFKCGKCGKFLNKKYSKYGAFFACSSYPKCKQTYKIDKDGKPIESEAKEVKLSEYCCPACGEQLIIRVGKKGNEYLGCKNWQKAECKGFYGIDGKKIEFTKKKSYKKGKKK